MSRRRRSIGLRAGTHPDGARHARACTPPLALNRGGRAGAGCSPVASVSPSAPEDAEHAAAPVDTPGTDGRHGRGRSGVLILRSCARPESISTGWATIGSTISYSKYGSLMKFGSLSRRRRRSRQVERGTVRSRQRVSLCYLVVDTSASMHGASINWVNAGLAEFFEALLDDLHPFPGEPWRCALVSFDAEARVELQVSHDSEHPTVPVLRADGPANYVPVFDLLESMIARDVSEVRDSGDVCMRPLVCFVTDGRPVDRWEERFDELVGPKNPYHPLMVPCGVAGAEPTTMQRLTTWMYPVGPDDGSVVLFENLSRAFTDAVMSFQFAQFGPRLTDSFGRPLPNVSAASDAATKLRQYRFPSFGERIRAEHVRLLDDVARVMDIDVDVLTGECHQPEVARARELAMHVVWTQTRLNPLLISKLFGVRDRGAASHAVEKIQRQISRRPEVAEQVAEIIRKLDPEIIQKLDAGSPR